MQTITTTASAVQEQQIVTVSAEGGQYFLELDTSASGGSLQYSGYIQSNALPSASSDGSDVQSIISAMSNIINGPVTVTRSNLAGASNVLVYTILFPLAMGNVPQLVVHSSELTPAGTAYATVATQFNGNVIQGTFQLSFNGLW